MMAKNSRISNGIICNEDEELLTLLGAGITRYCVKINEADQIMERNLIKGII